MKIAFLLGSGLSTAFDKLLLDIRYHKETHNSYGRVLPYKTGTYQNLDVLLLPRHGEKDGKPIRSPAELIQEKGYEANVLRLYEEGVDLVYGFSAVGALDLDIPIADKHAFVVPARVFRGFAASRHSFGNKSKNVHSSLDDIFDLGLQKKIGLAIRETGCMALENGLYIYNGGDCFESSDEIAVLDELTQRRKPYRVVGMTTVPEGMLLSQMKIPFAAICSNVNYANGIVPGAIVDHEETKRVMAIAKKDIVQIVEHLLNLSTT
ncbi:MAG: hypothetical protein Q8R18_06465 [bacterium]|nr:hypothetical protein [bacterium]